MYKELARRKLSECSCKDEQGEAALGAEKIYEVYDTGVYQVRIMYVSYERIIRVVSSTAIPILLVDEERPQA